MHLTVQWHLSSDNFMVELEKHWGSESQSKLKQKLKTVRTLTKDQKDKTNSWLDQNTKPTQTSRECWPLVAQDLDRDIPHLKI